MIIGQSVLFSILAELMKKYQMISIIDAKIFNKNRHIFKIKFLRLLEYLSNLFCLIKGFI